MAEAKVKRSIVKIDESKCDGCGNCVPNCAEGALQIIDGKAKLVKEIYCDGLGACLGECPQGALTIEERESESFDEKATEEHIKKINAAKTKPPAGGHSDDLPCGCPSTSVQDFSQKKTEEDQPASSAGKPVGKVSSQLRQWPIQLKLVPPVAPFLQNSDLVLAADCVSFAYGNFHADFLKGKSLLIGCPKLDDAQMYQKKITDIINLANLKSLTVLYMEVPCCFGLVNLAKQALEASGKKIPFKAVKIGIQGNVVEE